jgi:putative transcriptional regulator
MRAVSLFLLVPTGSGGPERGPVDVRPLRSKLGLSQSEFASQYGISLRTLQEWEQGRTNPDSAVRAYLAVIERNTRGR